MFNYDFSSFKKLGINYAVYLRKIVNVCSNLKRGLYIRDNFFFLSKKRLWTQYPPCFHLCNFLFSLSGDQLAIGKETGRRLGMGTNMYPSSALLGQNKDESIAALPVDDLIEKADGFAGVFPGMLLRCDCNLMHYVRRLISCSKSSITWFFAHIHCFMYLARTQIRDCETVAS